MVLSDSGVVSPPPPPPHAARAAEKMSERARVFVEFIAGFLGLLSYGSRVAWGFVGATSGLRHLGTAAKRRMKENCFHSQKEMMQASHEVHLYRQD